jgi:hypothetical protein
VCRAVGRQCRGCGDCRCRSRIPPGVTAHCRANGVQPLLLLATSPEHPALSPLTALVSPWSSVRVHGSIMYWDLAELSSENSSNTAWLWACAAVGKSHNGQPGISVAGHRGPNGGHAGPASLLPIQAPAHTIRTRALHSLLIMSPLYARSHGSFLLSCGSSIHLVSKGHPA